MIEFLKKYDNKSISVNQIDKVLDSVELLDIREPYEYKGGSLRNAKNIPMGSLLNNPERYLDKSTTYYIMCQSGGRSAATCKELNKMGYRVINVVGGISAYKGTNRL